MTEHTPGPWRCVEPAPGDDCWRILATDANIAHVLPEDEVEANAALIAAAPDLLAACERLYARLHSAEQLYGGVAKLAATAIAKATHPPAERS